MKYDVSYTRKAIREGVFYSKKDELSCSKTIIEADSKIEALRKVKVDIIELLLCNGFEVEEKDNDLIVCEPSGHELIEYYCDFVSVRVYILLDENGQEYPSLTPGTIGGYRRKKIYGRLDCPSAKRYIAKGQYVKHRVFFADEKTAKAAGYRPCGVCMREEYNKWKAGNNASE